MYVIMLCIVCISCIVWYCIVLYCMVLYCTALHCIVLYCTVLYCTALYCIVLHACMYVCMYACMYVCMYVRTCVRVYVCRSMGVWMHACIIHGPGMVKLRCSKQLPVPRRFLCRHCAVPLDGACLGVTLPGTMLQWTGSPRQLARALGLIGLIRV